MIQGAKKISQLQTLTVNGSEIVPVVQDDGLGNLTTGTLPITDFGSDTNFANTDLTLTGNRTHTLGANSLEFSGGFIGMNTTPSSSSQLTIDAGAKPYAIYATGPTIAILGSGDVGVSGTGSTFGVRGLSSSIQGVRGETTTGAGVAGASGGSGVGVLGTSSTGVAGDFKGGLFVEGSGGSGSINASAIIQADSTTRGALLPRMTTAQRDAIATPATGLEIYNTTTNRKEFYNGSYWRGDTFDMNVISAQYSPTASTTNYFGNLVQAPTATSAIRKMYIRKAGVIRFAEIYSRAGTAGTGENWSLYIRLNDTTDYLIQTVGAATQERIWTNSSLNIPVVAGDYVEIKMINPAWVTSPVNIAFGGVITIE